MVCPQGTAAVHGHHIVHAKLLSTSLQANFKHKRKQGDMQQPRKQTSCVNATQILAQAPLARFADRIVRECCHSQSKACAGMASTDNDVPCDSPGTLTSSQHCSVACSDQSGRSGVFLLAAARKPHSRLEFPAMRAVLQLERWYPHPASHQAPDNVRFSRDSPAAGCQPCAGFRSATSSQR
jgi:hypothetical protein